MGASLSEAPAFGLSEDIHEKSRPMVMIAAGLEWDGLGAIFLVTPDGQHFLTMRAGYSLGIQ